MYIINNTRQLPQSDQLQLPQSNNNDGNMDSLKLTVTVMYVYLCVYMYSHFNNTETYVFNTVKRYKAVIEIDWTQQNLMYVFYNSDDLYKNVMLLSFESMATVKHYIKSLQLIYPYV